MATLPEEMTVIVNLDIAPTEKAKEFVRQVVIDTLKELFTESTWLEERVNTCVEHAFARQVRQIRNAGAMRGS